MSFARWGADSAVYVFADVSGGVTCCGCLLDTSMVQVAYTDFFGTRYEVGDQPPFGASGHFYDAESLIDHLQQHRDAGHAVPDRLFDPTTYKTEDFARDGHH